MQRGVSLFSNECGADLNGGKKSQSENELGLLTGKAKTTTYLEERRGGKSIQRWRIFNRKGPEQVFSRRNNL